MFQQWTRILESPYPPLMILRTLVMISLVFANMFKSPIDMSIHISVIIFFVVSYFWIMRFKKHLWIVFTLEGLISLFIAFNTIDTSYPYQLLIGLVGLGFFLYYEGKSLYITWSVVFIALLIMEFVFSLHEVAEVLINFSFILFASLTGGLIRSSYQLKNRFEALYRERNASYQKLQEHAQTVEQLAMEKERNRIAREIHDTVGHTVTALIFQLEAARKWLTKDPKKSIEMLRTTEGLARSIYQEIRFSIETDTPNIWDHLDLDDLFQQLTNDFSRHTQLTCSYQIHGDSTHKLTRNHKMNLYRIVQETLTNAKRHGWATQVWIELELGDELALKIVDNGTGTDQFQLGFGLTSLQQRVHDLGGECHFKTMKGNGFQTTIRFPIKERKEQDDSLSDR